MKHLQRNHQEGGNNERIFDMKPSDFPKTEGKNKEEIEQNTTPPKKGVRRRYSVKGVKENIYQ